MSFSIDFLPPPAILHYKQATSQHWSITATSTHHRGPLLGILTAAIIVLGIALIPVMLVHVPPLVGYRNHMARMHILADAGSFPLLAQYYEIHWNILPNLAMDLVVPPLTRFMPLETASRVFIGLTLRLTGRG